jgi:glutaminase
LTNAVALQMGAMKSPIPDYLRVVLDNARANEGGAPAGYIETLAKADTTKMAVALAMVDGKVYSAGDDEVEFSIQVSHALFSCGEVTCFVIT